MKIVGLISDTHIPSRAKALSKKVTDTFKDASLIIHAGDLTELDVIRELEHLAPVVAIQGNMDSPETKARLPKINFVQLDNCRIGVVHNIGFFSTSDIIRKLIADQKLDVVAYGHLHRPSIKWKNNVLLINPGSPTNPIPPFVVKPTIALLRIFSDHVEPEIIEVK